MKVESATTGSKWSAIPNSTRSRKVEIPSTKLRRGAFQGRQFCWAEKYASQTQSISTRLTPGRSVAITVSKEMRGPRIKRIKPNHQALGLKLAMRKWVLASRRRDAMDQAGMWWIAQQQRIKCVMPTQRSTTAQTCIIKWSGPPQCVFGYFRMV